MKRFKTKKRRNNKLIIFIFILLFFIIFVILSLQKLNTSHELFINYLFEKTFINDEKTISKTFINLNSIIMPYEFDEKENIIDKKEVIYLYNTHSDEKYSDNSSIYDGTLLLQNNLKKLGISSLVENKKTSSFLQTGLSYYNISRTFLMEVMKNNTNIKYYIDIHRDSVTNTTIELNNKRYAKILFVLGCDNPQYEENEKILNKMNNYLNENYPGLSKGILKKSGEGVDGIYNQDLSSNVLLIEIGGIENNLEEVNNSTEIIALMLYNLLGE